MSIGSRLREAREKKNFTIDQVYRQTKIHPHVISAIEKDEYNKILNPTYIKSFLKEYASYLGLDAAKIVDEYKNISSKAKEQDGTGIAAKKPENNDQTRPEKPAVKIDFAKLVIPMLKWSAICLVVFFISKSTINFVKNKIDAPKIKKAKQIKQETVTVVKKQDVLDSAFKSIVIPDDEKLMLTINATDDAWLNLKVDGKVMFQQTLKKGTSENWEANKQFAIWTGKAHALELNLNGAYIGTAGRGVIKDLIIDRKGKRN